jgi:hypothetical protein
LRKHKPWFDEGCPKLLDQRNTGAKPNKWDHLNTRREASRHFRNKKKGISEREN